VREWHRFCEVDEDDESLLKSHFEKLPTVIRGMAGFDCDERSATGGTNFVVRDQLAFDNRAIVS
jgi:hypothetical protein